MIKASSDFIIYSSVWIVHEIPKIDFRILHNHASEYLKSKKLPFASFINNNDSILLHFVINPGSLVLQAP